MLSFVSMRTAKQARRLEAIAEWVFLGGLAFAEHCYGGIAFAIA